MPKSFYFIQSRKFFISLAIALVLTNNLLLVAQQNAAIEFKNYSDADGLSSNSIIDIKEDSKGFLWFATEDGLNKFDGYTFKSFQKNLNDTQTISQNRVNKIILDKNENLWLLCGDLTINLFDISTEKVKRFDSILPNGIPNKDISAILIDSKNNLWIAIKNKKIYKIKLTEKNFTAQNKYDEFVLPKGIISEGKIMVALFEDANGTIWIEDNDWNFNKLITQISNEKEYHFEKFDERLLCGGKDSNLLVGRIKQDSEGNYWFGEGTNLVEYNSQKGVLNSWNIESGTRSHACFLNNDVWIGTYDGLAKLSRKTNTIEYFNYVSGKAGSVAYKMVNCIFIDAQGIFWVATHNGLSKYDPNKRKFFLSQKDKNAGENSLLDNRIRAITTDDSDYVWLGTDQYGLSRYNLKTGAYKNFVHTGKSKNEISNNGFGVVHFKNNLLIVGTFNSKIEKLDAKGNIVPFKNESAINHWYKCIAEDKNGLVWIGSTTELNVLNATLDSIFKIDFLKFNIPYSLVRCVAPDEENALWFGTENGILYKLYYSPKGEPEKFEKYNLSANQFIGINNNTINTICIAGNYLWLGTYGGGLKRFSLIKGEFKTYLQKDGLPNDVIYGILEDAHGNLWMSSNRGISKFNMQTEKFTNYTPADGLQGYEYNSSAYCKNKKGYMFFGGTNGWNMFHPDSIKENTYQPEIVFTDFQIFNKHVDVSENSFLKKDLNYLNEISLTHLQSVFSFEFAALNFTNSVNNQYQYKLEGYDNDWQFTGTRRFITFTNLDPGDYTLKIKGSNNDGVWSNKIKSLRICILPAWYQTWWFYLLLVLAAIGITTAIIYAFIRFRRIKNEEHLKIRELIKKDLHDDLKSDLAAIQSKAGLVTKVLLRGDKEKAITRSNEITELTQRALSTVDDLSWAFNPKEDSLTELFKRMKNFIVAILPEEINYKLDIPQQDFDIVLPFKTRKHFYLIFKECLYNMVKHSKCKNAFIGWEITNQKLLLVIQDDGVGFDLKNLSRQNGLVHIQERATEINGILKIESQPNEGTFISLEIPIT